MDFAGLQRVWNQLGTEDPLWAVLTKAEAKGGRWDPDQFFASGGAQVDQILSEAYEHNVTFNRGVALDFGCGVGRLTQALAGEFDSVVGVDIAASMVAEAERRNRQGAKCRFVVNDQPDLNLFESSTFDFVLSLLVLQHMEPRYSSTYISEFVRVLRPGGVAVFQLPSERSESSQLARREVALPDGAYRAALSSPRSSLRATVGSVMPINVTATNQTPYAWPTSTAGLGLAIGNHWYSADGTLIALGDGRVYLPEEVAAGASLTVNLPISVPPEPGSYILEIDLVHDGVAWFSQYDSPTLRLPVEARRARWAGRGSNDQGRGERVTAVPVMEMNVLSRPDVTELVESAGGKIAWVDAREIPCFTDCTYFVTKS